MTEKQLLDKEGVSTLIELIKRQKEELATVAITGEYDDLHHKPVIPTVPTKISAFTNDVGYLTLEADPIYSASPAAGITSSDISNWNSKTDNIGTITGITMNGTSKGTSGVVDLGTVLTEHLDISNKADKRVVVTFTENNGVWQASKTFAEINALNDAGTMVVASFPTQYDYDYAILSFDDSPFPRIVGGKVTKSPTSSDLYFTTVEIGTSNNVTFTRYNLTDYLTTSAATSTYLSKIAFNNYNPILEDTRTSATAVVTANAPFDTLVDGQRVTIKFAYNTASNIDSSLKLTLSNGNKTDAIPIYFSYREGGNSRVSVNYKIYAGTIMPFIYDSTNNRWHTIGDKDTTTNVALSNSLIQGGTNDVNRLVSAKVLRDNFYTESEIDTMLTSTYATKTEALKLEDCVTAIRVLMGNNVIWLYVQGKADLYDWALGGSIGDEIDIYDFHYITNAYNYGDVGYRVRMCNVVVDNNFIPMDFEIYDLAGWLPSAGSLDNAYLFQSLESSGLGGTWVLGTDSNDSYTWSYITPLRDAIAGKADKTLVSNTIPLTGLLPNVEYDFGTTDIVNIVLDTTNIDTSIANEWHFFFTALSASCDVNLPNGVYLGNGYTWDMVAGRIFEVSIKRNIAYVGYCDPPNS